MRFVSVVAVSIALCACKEEKTTVSGLTLEGYTYINPGTTPAPTAPETNDIPFDCYALYERDDKRDGTINADGFDGYDASHPERLLHREIDNRRNGSIDYIEEVIYTPEGALLSHSYDHDGDGTAEETYAYTYDEENLTSSVSLDVTGDGVFDYSIFVVYDEEGRFETLSTDNDGDGVIDESTRYLYGEDGQISATEEDSDNDGAIDIWSSYRYDAVERLIEIAGDAGNDGTIDRLEATTYTDPVLEVGLRASDYENDGVIDERTEFAYDAFGNTLLEASDFGADGVIDWSYAYVWDTTLGVIVSSDVFNAFDLGYAARVLSEMTYDDNARLLTKSTEVYDPVTDQLLDESDEIWTFGGLCP